MAHRFRFRLDVVLKLRRQRQDECRRAVASRVRAIAEAESRLAGLTGQMSEEFSALRRLVTAEQAGVGSAAPPAGMTGASVDRPAQSSVVVDLSAVRQHRLYANRLRQEIADAGAEIARLREQLRVERAVLTAASKDVKALEKLEARQRARHELGLARAETIEADEVAAQFARRSNGGANPMSQRIVGRAVELSW